MKNSENIKNNIAIGSVYLAVSIIIGYVESIITISFIVPGVKLGLANVVTVFAMYIFIYKRIFIISFRIVVIIGIFFGNLITTAFSMAGFLASFLVMMLLHKSKKFSILIICIYGSVFHVITQYFVASILIKNVNIYKLLPISIVLGIFSGVVVGLMSKVILCKIKNIHIAKNGI